MRSFSPRIPVPFLRLKEFSMLTFGKRLAMLALVAFFFTSATPSHAAERHTAESLASIAKSLSEMKGVLVDVREKDEWNDGHLAAAKPLPLSTLRAGVRPDDLARYLPKDKPIYIHCASGRRCLMAAEVLRKFGYDVRPLKPGFDDLVMAGFQKAR